MKLHDLTERQRRGLILLRAAVNALNDDHSHEDEQMLWCRECGGVGIHDEELAHHVYVVEDARFDPTVGLIRSLAWDVVEGRTLPPGTEIELGSRPADEYCTWLRFDGSSTWHRMSSQGARTSVCGTTWDRRESARVRDVPNFSGPLAGEGRVPFRDLDGELCPACIPAWFDLAIGQLEPIYLLLRGASPRQRWYPDPEAELQVAERFDVTAADVTAIVREWRRRFARRTRTAVLVDGDVVEILYPDTHPGEEEFTGALARVVDWHRTRLSGMISVEHQGGAE